MASFVNMDTNAKSLAYPQDFRIEVQSLAICKRYLTIAVLYIFIISY